MHIAFMHSKNNINADFFLSKLLNAVHLHVVLVLQLK